MTAALAASLLLCAALAALSGALVAVVERGAGLALPAFLWTWSVAAAFGVVSAML